MHSSEYLIRYYHVNRIYTLAILAIADAMMGSVNYENLKLFRDIAQTRSFSRAAALNGVSQSAASQHVQDLEQVLGTQSTRPVNPAAGGDAAGQLYCDFCRDVLRRKESSKSRSNQLKQEVDGTVRVASIYSVGLSEMVQLEKEFARRQPKAQLEVEYLRPEKVYSAVLADQADLGLVSYPEPSREITVIPWRQEEMVLAAAPDHPLAKRGQDRARRISTASTSSASTKTCRSAAKWTASCASRGSKSRSTLHFDNLQMIKEAVAHRRRRQHPAGAHHARRNRAGPPGRDSARGVGALPSAGDHSPQEETLSSPWRRRFWNCCRKRPALNSESLRRRADY